MTKRPPRKPMIAYRRVIRSGPIVSYHADEAAARQAAEQDVRPATERTIETEGGEVIETLPDITPQKSQKAPATAPEGVRANADASRPAGAPKGD